MLGSMRTPDPGLFGPGSVTWRVAEDPSGFLGGVRSLFLSALHPLAMAGVAQFSAYRSDPWGRLARTGQYLATITFGTTEEARRAGDQVRAIHDRLAGIEPESGRPFRVGDPDLVRWVHCSEVDSFLSAYERCGGRLGPGDADAYVAEQVRSAELVGLDPATVPASRAALDGYFAQVLPELRATAEAHRVARFLLVPPVPAPLLPAGTFLGATAFGLLPRWARGLYGPPLSLTANPVADLPAGLAGRMVRSAVLLLPAPVRTSPTRRAAERRLSPAA